MNDDTTNSAVGLAIKTFKTSFLKEYESNPRKNDHAVDKMAEAIKEFGFRVPIVAKSDGTVVDGHLRLKAARKLGLAEVPVILADDLTELQIKAFRISVNKVADLAEWDTGLLADELKALGEAGFDLDLTGFDDVELVTFLAGKTDGLTDPDDVPEAPVNPVTVLGDVWVCGKHRVMCGDSLDLGQVGTLLGGVVPEVANCDPPYGINIVSHASASDGGAKPFGKQGHVHALAPLGPALRQGRVHGPAKRAIIKPGVYAQIIGDDTTETAIHGYAVLTEIGVPAIVLWGGNYFANALPPSRCWLVWDKENTGSFADAELAWTNRDAVVRVFRHQWSGLIKASERGEKRSHPTQKPVALGEWVLETVAPKAKTMIDLFLGSGSALIAAERKGVACFGMEMAPAYVDVAVKRWQEFTGAQAVLEGDGRTFAEIDADRYDPQKDSAASYDAAIAAKREAIDAQAAK